MMNWHMIIPGLIVVVIKAVGTTLFLLYFSQLFERNNESFVPTGSYGTRISFFAQSAVQKDDYAPYLVYLKSHFNPCVGVLIKPSWVLAPSHCYLPNMKVMLGNFKSRIRDGTEQTINPIQIIRYWKYNDTGPQDDLMLIRLAKPATFNPKVQVLPIATSDVWPGTICVLSGLDWSQENNGRHPDLRQNLEAPVMTDKDCQNTEQGRSHRNSLCVKFVKVFNRIFGEVAVATVICKDKLQGIEVGNFMGGDVGIYTNVYKYVSWIEENTKDRKK